MAEKAQSIHVSNLAKYKTAIQMIAIQILLLGDLVANYILQIGEITLTIAAILTLITGWQYMIGALKIIRAEDS